MDTGNAMAEKGTIEFMTPARAWPSGEIMDIKIEKKNGVIYVDGQESEMGFDGTQLWFRNQAAYLFVFDSEKFPPPKPISEMYNLLNQ